MQIKNFTFYLSTFSLLGGLLSCGSLPQSSMNAINLRSGVATTTSVILNQDFKATVYLQGRWLNLFPCLSSGRINCKTQLAQSVLTNQAGLQLEDKVLIKVNIHYQSIPLAGKDFGKSMCARARTARTYSTRSVMAALFQKS